MSPYATVITTPGMKKRTRSSKTYLGQVAPSGGVPSAPHAPSVPGTHQSCRTRSLGQWCVQCAGPGRGAGARVVLNTA